VVRVTVVAAHDTNGCSRQLAGDEACVSWLIEGLIFDLSLGLGIVAARVSGAT
jgi:hypothetical protein